MTGRLSIVGMGPGDPELITLRAANVLRQADAVAFFARRGSDGHARATAAPHLPPGVAELRFDYPLTTEQPATDALYTGPMTAFYDHCATSIAAKLHDGQHVALLCEGDPFLYGSAMYVFDRLHDQADITVVPGITGMAGCWARAALPMTHGDDVLSVLPGTLPEDALTAQLSRSDAAVIMKTGRNMPKIKSVLAKTGLLDRAVYVARGTMPDEHIAPLRDAPDAAPYFSLVLLPGRRRSR